MNFEYNPTSKYIIFRIHDFPSHVQTQLLSTLDVNGFIANEIKFRDIIAQNAGSLPLNEVASVKPLILEGHLINVYRDAEKGQLGLNFRNNAYKFTLEDVPGRNLREGLVYLAIVGVEKSSNNFIVAYRNNNGQYRFAGKTPLPPFLKREKLFEDVEKAKVSGPKGIDWVDPDQFKKVVAVKYSNLNPVLDNGVLTAIPSNPEVIDVVDIPELDLLNLGLNQAFPSKEIPKSIALDLDGTLACNDGDDIGTPFPNAIETVQKLKDDGYEIVIFSHRTEHPGGLEQVIEWLETYEVPYDKIWTGKPYSRYFVDDRAIEFTTWDQVYQEVRARDQLLRETSIAVRGESSLEEIQKIVKDPTWQKLREDLSWKKEDIGSSLRRLREYLGERPSRAKKVRVLNLLNAVARGGIAPDALKSFQEHLRKQLKASLQTTADLNLSYWIEPDGTVHDANFEVSEAGASVKGHLAYILKNIKELAQKWGTSSDSSNKEAIANSLIEKGWMRFSGTLVILSSMTDAQAAALKELVTANKDKIMSSSPLFGFFAAHGLPKFIKVTEVIKNPQEAYALAKKAAFMPSLPGVLWECKPSNSLAPGAPLENLHPVNDDYSTFDIYTRIPDKKQPGGLLRMLRKTLPLSKDDPEKEKKEAFFEERIPDPSPVSRVKFWISPDGKFYDTKLEDHSDHNVWSTEFLDLDVDQALKAGWVRGGFGNNGTLFIEVAELINLDKFVITEVADLAKYIEVTVTSGRYAEFTAEEWHDSGKSFTEFIGEKLRKVATLSYLKEDASPEVILEHALNYIKAVAPSKWEEAEESISKDPYFSFAYAQTHGERFQKGEDSISKVPYLKDKYAKEIVKDPSFWEGRS